MYVPRISPSGRFIHGRLSDATGPTHRFSDSVEPQTSVPRSPPHNILILAQPTGPANPSPQGLPEQRPKIARLAITPVGYRAGSVTFLAGYIRYSFTAAESLLIVVVPVIFFLNWEFLLPRVFAVLDIERPEDNPFAPCILLSHRAPGSDPRYGRGKGDITFIAYHVVVFSLIRQFITGTVAPRVGRFFGLTRTAKLERFGEQGYAFVYFFVFGAWGVVCQPQSVRNHVIHRDIPAHNVPTPDVVVPDRAFLDWCVFVSLQSNPSFHQITCADVLAWHSTDYPHTLIPSELKRYYLMQTAYWMQQFLVLVLGLEKPRKDYAELVAHHVVTLFLVMCVSFLSVF